MCDTTKGLVAVDGVMAALLGVGAIATADESSSAALLLGLFGAAFVASAIHGNGAVDECNDASIAWERDYSRHRRPIDVPDEQVASGPPAMTPPSNRLRMRQQPVILPPATIAPPQVETPPPTEAPPQAPAPKASTPVAKRTEAGEWSSFWEETP